MDKIKRWGTIESMTQILLIAIFSILGLIIGPYASKVAARRTVAQPVGMEVESEKEVFASLFKDPSGYVFVSELKPEHFTKIKHRELWSAIEKVYADVESPNPKASVAEFEEASKLVPTDLLERLQIAAPELNSLIASIIKGEDGASKSEHGPEKVLDKNFKDAESVTRPSRRVKGKREDLIEHGAKVFAAAEDRDRFGGAAKLTFDDSEGGAYHREYAKPTVKRMALSSALLGAAGALSPWIATLSGASGSLEHILAAAAVFTLAAFSLIWALVDHDTMYIDMPTFYIGATSAWLLTIFSALAAGDLKRLIAGIAVAIGTVIVFEGGNAIFAKLNGQHGMGMGDSILIIATVGVPAALTGNWILGYWIVLTSMILAIIGWLIGSMVAKNNTNQPFAFGPYLAGGWILAMIYFASFNPESLMIL